MSREAFEKVFPIPTTMIRWDDKCQAYVSVSGRMSMTADTYNDMLRVWQAATAMQAERVRELEEALRDAQGWLELLRAIIDKEPT